MSLLKEGEVIHNTYEVERFLGEGAFAEVYRVKHRFLGRQAMKVFKRIGMSVKDVEEMLSEAILLSRIGHPNIVRVFDANVTETSTGLMGFFTMEYVAGGTLDQFWRSDRRSLMPVETAVDILRQVCRGLVVAHRENPPIIHRDIKPQNILIGYDGHGLHARLSDFGLAKRVNPMTLMASSQGKEIRNCTIITTDSNDLVRPIHDRMPVILPQDAEDRWLDPGEHDREQLQSFLKPYPAEEMDAYDVTAIVNNTRHDAPDCIIPATAKV